jgi:hypothetical protein
VSRLPRAKLPALIAGFVGLNVLLVAGVMVWGSWITPLEKRSLRRALSDVEAVQRLHGDEPEFQRAVDSAEASLAICRKRSITEYDSRVTMMLEMNLDDSIKEKKVWKLSDSNPEKQKMVEEFNDTDTSSDMVIRRAIE